MSSSALKYKHIALIGKYHVSSVSMRETLLDLAHFLMDQGAEVVLDQDSAGQWAGQELGKDFNGHATLSLAQIGQQCDLAMVVGGDGTMLGVGRQLASYGLPLIGINHGRLGFITDIALTDYKTALPAMLRGEHAQEERSLMQAQVMRDGVSVFDALALNDVVINRGAGSGMVELRVEVDGRFVANQRADGLIVASPTGSTAYALSAGGPIMHPDLKGWLLVPIAPHTLSNRPLALADSAQIAIELVAGKEASANFDMQNYASLLVGDRIVVSRSPHRVTYLHPSGWSYYDTLRRKLHWNEGTV
ncbi:MAG: NAD kinase [Brachymonas sp.]|nr:NAD kinase [Brachymonas sp.]NJS36632.1 NAD kinase [Brachymonas sp.]